MDKDDLEFSEVSEEVREKYAFPSKEMLQKFKDGAIQESLEDMKQATNTIYRLAYFFHQDRDLAIIGVTGTLAMTHYMAMRTPGGNVARAQYVKSLSPMAQLLRRTSPFIYAAIPIVILRSYVHELKFPFSK